MFRWISKIIERLFPPPSRIIEVMVDGKIERAVAQSVVGLGFHCAIPSSDGNNRTRVITAASAVDQKHFWRLWRSMGGSAFYPDGSEFRPDK